MEKQICIYGAGGHGKVIEDIIKSLGFEIKNVYDNNPNKTHFSGLPIYPVENITKESCPIIITVGDNGDRKRIAEKLEESGIKFATLIHPKALLADNVEIGEGSMVCLGAVIQTGAKIGRHCIINSGAIIEHDCIIGDYAHISPGAVLCGGVKIGEGTWIGAGSTVIQYRNIGNESIVGAGSTVIKDLESGVVAVGSPTKIIRHIKSKIN